MKKAYIAGGAIALSSLALLLTNSTTLTQMMRHVRMTPAEQHHQASDESGRVRSESDDKVDLSQKLPAFNSVTPTPNGAETDGNASQLQRSLPGTAPHEMASPLPYEPTPQQPQYVGRDDFERIEANPVKLTSEAPVSTFSIDVDTASYSFVRRKLNEGVLPQKDAVRVEEMINYFDYDYALPESKDKPFRPSVAVYDTPWNDATELLHIGIQGHDIVPQQQPRSNLVFLIDTSGSMQSQDKLPLLKNAFRLMVENLDEEDTVSIATYAGSAGVVLEPTQVKDKQKIMAALNGLRSGGSTAGAQGIKLAYQLAEANFDKEAVNRVFLATDGDFNVGITDRDELEGYIERKRKSGVFLSILGFGRGNYRDALMQTLAQNGNGTAAYIDTLNEARKVLVEEASSTLYPIARDVKIQVEFNPAQVAEYRLIGYETRQMNREDFNNDKVDAGELGAGHSVTAIYEITRAGSDTRFIEPLRYGQPGEAKSETDSNGRGNEIAHLRLRYKLPDEDTSRLIEEVVNYDNIYQFDSLPDDIRFATAVAAFGQMLSGGKYIKHAEYLGGGRYRPFSYDDVSKLAQSAKGKDPFGYRSEFINLVRLAKSARNL